MKKELYLWDMNNTQTHNTMKKEPIYGEDLATEIILKLRRNEFKTMSDEQIEKFRLAMAYYLDLKNL